MAKYSKQELLWIKKNSSEREKCEVKKYLKHKNKKPKKYKKVRETELSDCQKEWVEKTRKELLLKQTDAEREFYDILETLNIPFEKQFPFCINSKIFFADVAFLDNNVVIEIDGGYHTLPKVIKKDEKRTKLLNGIGYKVIRIKNEDIDNRAKVFSMIENYLPTKVSAYQFL